MNRQWRFLAKVSDTSRSGMKAQCNAPKEQKEDSRLRLDLCKLRPTLLEPAYRGANFSSPNVGTIQ